MTADHETVRGWIDEGEHDAIPVRYSGVEGESNQLRIVPESDVTDTHEELTWDDFGRELEESERVVVYHGGGDFEILDRDEAATRATVDSEGFEEALLEGETVTTEVTETKVVERTIVEEATIENEVVDRRRVDEEVVEAELLERDLVEFGLLVDTPGTMEIDDVERFDAGFPPEEEVAVEATLDEEWRLTKERTEELVVESRIVDTDAAETDTVASDNIEASVDTEHVQRSILESGLFGDEVGANEIIERGDIRSEFQEGAVVRTQLPVKTMVEEDVAVQKVLHGTLDDGETVESTTVRETELSSEVVSDYEFDSDLIVAQEGHEDTDVTGGTTTGTTEEGMTGDTTGTTEEGMTGDTTGTTAEEGIESGGAREGVAGDTTPEEGMTGTESEGSSEGITGSDRPGEGITGSDRPREGITGSEESTDRTADTGAPNEGMTESEGSVEGMTGSTEGGSPQRPDDAVAATPDRGPSEADEGKQVVNQDGENVGRVADVRGDTIYVEPDQSLTEKIAESLGWSDDDEDTYPVEADSVTSITDDHVYVSTSSSPSTAT